MVLPEIFFSVVVRPINYPSPVIKNMTTQSITNPLDRTQCPICGKSNNCGKEEGLEHCWCADLTFPRNPPQTVMSCFCRSCTDKMLEQEKAASNPAV